MPFEKTPETLARVVHDVLEKDDTIRARLTVGSYQEADLLADVVAEGDQIWEGVADEIRKHDMLEANYRNEEKRWLAEVPQQPEAVDVQKPLWKVIYVVVELGIFLYILYLLILAAYQLYNGWGTLINTLSLTATWLRIGAYIIPLIVLIVLHSWLNARQEKLSEAQKVDLERRREEWQRAAQAIAPSFGLEDIQKQVKAQLDRINTKLSHRVTLAVRSALNRRTDPSYSPFLDVERPRGFGEVSDVRFAIYTPARKRLQYLLDSLSGASIGIAGSRGAGKTTLMKSFCGPKQVVETLKGKPVLGILVSAPVAYQARDFLLYLFSTACQAVIEREGGRFSAPVVSLNTEVVQRDGYAPIPNYVDFRVR